MRILRVNETKRPCTNAFLVDSFSLESWKVSRNEEKSLFLDSSWSLGFSLNPEADRVLSSAKLCIEATSMKKNKSLIERLNKIGPSIDPCGTPEIISL